MGRPTGIVAIYGNMGGGERLPPLGVWTTVRYLGGTSPVYSEVHSVQTYTTYYPHNPVSPVQQRDMHTLMHVRHVYLHCADRHDHL